MCKTALKGLFRKWILLEFIALTRKCEYYWICFAVNRPFDLTT